MQIKYVSTAPARPSSLLRKAAALIPALALAGLALMFSALLIAVILVAVVLGGVVLWWKTRPLRRRMRDLHARGAASEEGGTADDVNGNEVIEGEVIRVVASPDGR
jgi:hypothetical protein